MVQVLAPTSLTATRLIDQGRASDAGGKFTAKGNRRGLSYPLLQMIASGVGLSLIISRRQHCGQAVTPDKHLVAQCLQISSSSCR